MLQIAGCIERSSVPSATFTIDDQEGVPVILLWSESHRWLGFLWRGDGDFSQHAAKLIAACAALVSLLATMSDVCKFPLAIIFLLFTVKVESKLRFGRWLWAACTEAQLKLDAAYESWAKQLLGFDPWRNGAIALGEAG